MEERRVWEQEVTESQSKSADTASVTGRKSKGLLKKKTIIPAQEVELTQRRRAAAMALARLATAGGKKRHRKQL